MESLGKETVIIVHGTWAAPKSDNPDHPGAQPDQPDHIRWYQIPDEGHDNFVSKLDKALERCGSPARCWAHCKYKSEVFSWTGKNAWFDRAGAASSLAAEINKLQADGWRCHVVAHSHGGNVAAEALPQLKALPEKPTGLNGTITTLGTPFINAMSPVMDRVARQRRRQKLVGYSFLILFMASFAISDIHDEGHLSGGFVFLLVDVLFIIASLNISKILFWMTQFCKRSRFWRNLHQKYRKNLEKIGAAKNASEFWSVENELAYRSGSRNEIVYKLNAWSIRLMRLRETLSVWIDARNPFKGLGFHLKRMGSWGEYWAAMANTPSPFMLSISSDMDEALQVLHVVREISNPLAPKSCWLGFLLTKRREYLKRSCEIERIQGVAFFPSARGFPKGLRGRCQFILAASYVGVFSGVFLGLIGASIILSASYLRGFSIPYFDVVLVSRIPMILSISIVLFLFILATTTFDNVATLCVFRWIPRQLRAFYRIGPDLIEYIIRQRFWALFQEIVFGLNGFRFELPEAKKIPTFACPIYKYEDLPKSVEQRALDKRDDWIRRAFGGVTETFSRLTEFTAFNLESLQRKVETDLSLVHATYYTDDKCIERIADWIAGKERMIGPPGGPVTGGNSCEVGSGST